MYGIGRIVPLNAMYCNFFSELVAANEMIPSAQYICSISPLLDIQLPSNSSYILTLEFRPPTFPENSSSFLNESWTFFANPALLRPSLTLIVESRQFHKGVFYLKCFFTPFLLTSLVWFCVKMYFNDLYISIPDRLLITAALAQFVQNIPTEVLVTQWPEPHLKLLDEISLVFLICSLQLFWAVFTLDKLATNEPFERNTRYYWSPILLISLGGITAALFSLYSRGPTFKNPFLNHWSTEGTITVSLGFVFGLALLALIYQTYLSVLVFRALCDISVTYPPSRYRAWRIKLVLLYCFAASVITVGGFVLHLAIILSLNWNPQFYIDPIPFHLTFSSPVILGLQGKGIYLPLSPCPR